MDRLRLLFVAAFLTALGSAASAQDRKVEFCSAGKKAWRMAVAYDTADGRRIEGWHAVPLGGCAEVSVPAGTTLYYAGESTDGLNLWPPTGLTDMRYCVQPRKDKFSYVIRKSRIEDAHKASRCPDDVMGPRPFLFLFASMKPKVELPY